MTDGLSPAADAAQRRARRRARLADAARLLPLLGLGAFLLPDLVLSGRGGSNATGPWLVYLFAVWAVLIVAAIRIARLAGREASTDGRDGDT